MSFGGYVGQDSDRERVKELKDKVDKDPKNFELRKEYNEYKREVNDRYRSALLSYARL